jgi:integrase/recombinase XerD
MVEVFRDSLVQDCTNLSENQASPVGPQALDPQVDRVVCPECGNLRVFNNGHRTLRDGSEVQRFKCGNSNCGHRFSGTILNTVNDNIGSSQICAELVKNLVSQTEETTVCAGIENLQQDLKGKITLFMAKTQTKGLAEVTIKNTIEDLLRINQHSDLNDPVKVWFYIDSKKEWKQGTKQHHATAYVRFAKIVKIPLPEDVNFNKWFLKDCLPKYIPTESEIAQLIAGCNRKTATLLQLLSETGMRSGEAWRLSWENIDLERKILTLHSEDCEKDGMARQFKISDKLLSMLNLLKAKSKGKTIWAADQRSLNCLRASFSQHRKLIAKKTGNINFNKISLHTLRHFYACKLYHDTKDLLLVQQRIGHRNIKSTMVYTRIVEWDKPDLWIVSRPNTTLEEDQLLEAGFEYVRFDDKLQLPIYRKRK